MPHTTDSAASPPGESGEQGRSFLPHALAVCGAAALIAGVAGIVGLFFGINVLTGAVFGYRPIALSAACVWGFFGLILLSSAYRPLTGTWRAIFGTLTAFIAVAAALEFPLGLAGRHFILEDLINATAAPFFPGTLVPLSPLSALLIIPSAIGMFLLVMRENTARESLIESRILGGFGTFCSSAGFLFVISYLYRQPFFYGSGISPIAISSAFAGLCVGLGMIAAAGPRVFPLSYFSGTSTRARLLRFFIPFGIALVVLQSILSVLLVAVFNIRYAMDFAIILTLFCILCAGGVWVVAGRIGQTIDNEREMRELAEKELRQRTVELEAAHEEITASEEELRQNYEELSATEEELRQNYEQLAKSEKELRESEEKFRQFFERNYAIMFMLDPGTGQILDANPAASEFYGYSREALRAKNISEINVDSPEEVARLRGRVVEGTLHSYVTHHRLATGSTRTIEVHASPINTGTGTYLFYIAHDTTEREAEQAQREQLILDLGEKNAELERFTYTVSHDLKSPLITIKGFAGFLAEDIQGNKHENMAHDLGRITSAAEKMEHLLTDLLNLSRIGRTANPPEEVSFTGVAQEATELLAVQIVTKGVSVIIDPDMPVVRIDRVRIREVVTNLVENAIKFTGGQEHPEIHIGFKNRNGSPVFFVQDNGIGIEPQYRERIFNLFEKLDLHQEGSGAGLTIIRRIIEVHGGKIWVESDGKGTGSTFFFTLPLAGQDQK